MVFTQCKYFQRSSRKTTPPDPYHVTVVYNNYDVSQGSRQVFQSVVFQLIFATLNMFFENTQIAGRKLKIRQDQFLEQFFFYLSGQKYH